MAIFSYNSTVRAEYSTLSDQEEIFIELGPAGGPPDVTFTIVDAVSVATPAGEPWHDCMKTFTAPADEFETVTASASEGSKVFHIKPKPHGGLPGESPV